MFLFKNNKRVLERGATALLIVVFTILLLVTITVGFMRLVVQDQSNTNNDELSRGAYDSALAGVEDGKRVLQACINGGDSDACNAISASQCNTVHSAKILSAADDSTNTSEVLIQNSVGAGGSFDQAYTCVVINRNTANYEGSVRNDFSTIVPLITTSSFTTINMSWFRNSGPGANINLNNLVNPNLPTYNQWSPIGQVRPPLLRVQLIQYNGAGFNLNDFDQGAGSSTLYLYPSSIGGTSTSFSIDARGSNSNNVLVPVRCNAISPQYVCNTTISLPLPVGVSASQIANRRAYLRITSLYGDTDFRVQPIGTLFQDIEPSIDSTGRASDVYRRVNARVILENPNQSQMYPRATVDLTKNFCKDFSVTNTAYIAGSCNYNLP